MHEVNVRLPIPDELWKEIAELAEKKSSRPGELAEFLVMVGLYHHLRQNIDMYKASIMLSERRKEGRLTLNFHFDGAVAEMYGVDGAVFISRLQFWIEKNAANDRHYHEGRYWTYNSLRAMEKLFPFWSRRQIERIVKNPQGQGCSADCELRQGQL